MQANPNLPHTELLRLVRAYANDRNDPAPYDVNGVIHLLLAAIDNLREHWIEADLEQLAESVDLEQRALLVEIGRYLDRHANR